VLGISPSVGGGAHHSYYMEINCAARSLPGANNTAYEVTANLVPKMKNTDPKSPNLKGFKEAKTAFDFLVLQVRKTVVKLEFPEFPEGCKGRPFREIYQLNARVRLSQIFPLYQVSRFLPWIFLLTLSRMSFSRP
jgi:hypothetical protein